MNNPYTIFPLSLHGEHTEENSFYYDEITHFAHQLIREDSRSPYEAWMMATSREISSLPDILGLTEAQTEELLDFSFLSPPPVAIARFCKELGVHPAHLLPYTTGPQYLEHDRILQTIVEIAKEKPKREIMAALGVTRLPDADYYECMDAFRLEQRRIKDFSSAASSHLKIISDRMDALRQSTTANPDDKSLRVHFHRTLGDRPSDVVEVCDLHAILLREKRDRHSQEFALASSKLMHLFEYMVDEGEILFGESHARETVIRIIHAIHANPEYKNLSLESKTLEKGALVAEYMQSDFLRDAMVSFRRPEDIVSEFSDLLDEYLRKHECAKEKQLFKDFSASTLDKFDAWRNSDKGREEIAMLTNFYRIRHFLDDGADITLGTLPAKRKLLTGPAPQ